MSEITHTGTGALKVDYNKNGFEWAAFSATFDGDQNFSSSDSITAEVYGDATLLVKLETSTQPIEKSFTVMGNQWNQIEWVFTPEEKEKLQDVKKMLLFAEPGTGHASGTFYLDDIQVNGKGPTATNLLIEGKAVVGETLTISATIISHQKA